LRIYETSKPFIWEVTKMMQNDFHESANLDLVSKSSIRTRQYLVSFSQPEITALT